MTLLAAPDIGAIIAVSISVPLFGNLMVALFPDRARAVLATPEQLRRMNLISGGLLNCVGTVIAAG